jgi:hypothetical protein
VHGGTAAALASAGKSVPLLLSRIWADGSTNLQETNALVWIMVALSAGGAIITFAFLVYALWKFRDPKMRDRRYG